MTEVWPYLIVAVCMVTVALGVRAFLAPFDPPPPNPEADRYQAMGYPELAKFIRTHQREIDAKRQARKSAPTRKVK